MFHQYGVMELIPMTAKKALQSLQFMFHGVWIGGTDSNDSKMCGFLLFLIHGVWSVSVLIRECFSKSILLGSIDDPLLPEPTCRPKVTSLHAEDTYLTGTLSSVAFGLSI
jgi:hypothetical protein